MSEHLRVPFLDKVPTNYVLLHAYPEPGEPLFERTIKKYCEEENLRATSPNHHEKCNS